MRSKKRYEKSEKEMNHYNTLKIRTLNVFAFAPGAWFRPTEVAERLDYYLWLPKTPSDLRTGVPIS
jgi:hypothetical protein